MEDETKTERWVGRVMVVAEEMREYFTLRTRAHLYLVRKWSDIIAGLNDKRIDRDLLDRERDEHDCLKWIEPELTPYIFITWNYFCKRKGLEFTLDQNMREQMHEATFHHIKRHKHHPEYWDNSASLSSLNKDDRDRPSSGALVDGTQMPLTYIAAMVADWFAMSEELGGHPKDWADQNLNIRWRFNAEQSELIYWLIERAWPKQKSGASE